MFTGLELLRESIKTSISATANVYDIAGQWVPPGNYYFLINYVGPQQFKGELNCRGFKAEYTFSTKDTVKMMAVAQARLARRANITDDDMPTYTSPLTSPANAYPTILVSHRYNGIQPPHTSPTFRQHRRRLPQLNQRPTCTICLDFLGDNPKELTCSHKFHLACITRWHSSRQTCPVCRRRFTLRVPPPPPISAPNRRVSRYAVIQRERPTHNLQHDIRGRDARRQHDARRQPDNRRLRRQRYRNQTSLPSLIS